MTMEEARQPYFETCKDTTRELPLGAPLGQGGLRELSHFALETFTKAWIDPDEKAEIARQAGTV